MDTIQLEHIKKTYTTLSTDIMIDHARRPATTRTVLGDLSLMIPAGQLTVIVGRSGCGKSTLLKLLSGTEHPDSGTIALPQGWHTALLLAQRIIVMHGDSTVRKFDLSALPYPRDLDSVEMRSLRDAVSQECRK